MDKVMLLNYLQMSSPAIAPDAAEIQTHVFCC